MFAYVNFSLTLSSTYVLFHIKDAAGIHGVQPVPSSVHLVQVIVGETNSVFLILLAVPVLQAIRERHVGQVQVYHFIQKQIFSHNVCNG